LEEKVHQAKFDQFLPVAEAKGLQTLNTLYQVLEKQILCALQSRQITLFYETLIFPDGEASPL
jgi:hypothetical protein